MRHLIVASAAALLAAPDAASATVASNKAMVARLYSEVFNGHSLAPLDTLLAQDYRQHNPSVPQGRDGFKKAFEQIFAADPSLHVDVKRVIAEGDLVVVHAHWTDSADPRGQAVVDIFRVDHGRIAEHWDVVQDVPKTLPDPASLF